MCNFHVGQKVVCVVDDWPNWIASPIQKGLIYTVAEIMPPEFSFSFDGPDVRPSIRLAETKNNMSNDGAFNPSRFRPVVERKTDISIFKAMLNKTPEQVPA